MKLNQLSDNAGAHKERTRVGRGIGSGKGKTGGRGVKGQKSRSGVSIKGFEGGQMPLYRRLPKRGFSNAVFTKNFVAVNLGRVQEAIDAKRIDISKPVDAAAIVAAGIVKNSRDGISLLGKGELTSKVEFNIARASASATAAVEKAGGKITLPEVKEVKEGKKAARKAEAAAKREAR
jgi:large subunit ribosomal protein L15